MTGRGSITPAAAAAGQRNSAVTFLVFSDSDVAQ